MDRINKCGCGGGAEFAKTVYGADLILCKKCGARSKDINGHVGDSEHQVLVNWNTAHPVYEPMQKKQYKDFLQSLLETYHISQYAFDTLSSFDYPVFEQPKISNADRVYEWLKQGKFVEDPNTKASYRLNEGVLECSMPFSKNWNALSISLNKLFETDWQLYEEPKFKEVSYKDAIAEVLLNDKKVTVIHSGEEKLFCGVKKSAKKYDKFVILYEEGHGYQHCEAHNFSFRTDFRVYE